jgi:hypothetical protein
LGCTQERQLPRVRNNIKQLSGEILCRFAMSSQDRRTPRTERRTIHLVDLDRETGEVPIRKFHVVDVPRQPGQRVSILTIDFGPALEKLEQLEAEAPKPFDGPRLYVTDD